MLKGVLDPHPLKYIRFNCNHREVLTIFFLSGFSFTDTDDSQDSWGREGTIFYFTLPLPPAHEHSDIYLQLCMWDDYHIFLIVTLVFTRLLLDDILPPYRITIWLIDDVKFVLVFLLDDLILGFCYSNLHTGNWWIRARIDYHPCITSEPTNQVCWSPQIIWINLDGCFRQMIITFCQVLPSEADPECLYHLIRISLWQ